MILALTAMPATAAGVPAVVTGALKQAGIPLENVAIIVQQVDKTKPLVAHNPTRPMNPASTMKLLTTYAGLELLGPAYTWKTEIYAAGELKDGVLEGDLILKGYGDPAVTLERFHELLRMLKNTGLREIRGDLVLDNRWFDLKEPDPGTFDGEPWRAYNAAPDALLVNFKATQFTFSPDTSLGKVRISPDPALPLLLIVNKIELQPGSCTDWKGRLGEKVQKDGDVVTVTFTGNYSPACGDKSLEMSVLENAPYVYALFRQWWMENGGTLRGGFRLGETPGTAKRLAAMNSPPLADAIRLINKYSNNVMARQMLLTIGAEKSGPPGNVNKGIRSIQSWLEEKKLDFPELVLENGAGLSRRERISALHMENLLNAAWKSPVMPELMSSLPVAAVDGTLQKRLRNSAIAGQAHIKTGSLDDVRAIAGYLLDQKGRRWIVVMIINHPNAQAARSAQDALLEWVYQATDAQSIDLPSGLSHD